MFEFKFKAKKKMLIWLFLFLFLTIYALYEFCFHVLLKELFVAFVNVGGSPGTIFTAS